LRDLLKFEFFFPEKEEFRREITADLDSADRDWREATPKALLKLLEPKTADWVIRPFLQAYLVVSDELAASTDQVSDEKTFIASCLRRGESYRLRGLIGADGISTILFRQALALAQNRGLLQPDSDEARRAFAAEVRRALKVE
jgi:glycerol-3-phosphate O-acyltransferase